MRIVLSSLIWNVVLFYVLTDIAKYLKSKNAKDWLYHGYIWLAFLMAACIFLQLFQLSQMQ